MYSNYLYPYTQGQKACLDNRRSYPNSTLKQIVFPLDKSKNQYDINLYQTFMSNDQISKYQIDMMFKDLYLQVEYFSYKSTLYLKKLYYFSTQLPAVVFLISLIVHFSIFDPFLNNHVIKILLTILECISVFWGIYGTFHLARIHKRIEVNTRIQILMFLENENRKNYQNKAIHWSVPKHHFNWIELHFDYKNREEHEAYYKVLHELVSSELTVLIFPFNSIHSAYEKEFYKAEISHNRLARSKIDIFIDKVTETAHEDLLKLMMKKRGLFGIIVATLIGIIGVLFKYLNRESSNVTFAYAESIFLLLYFMSISIFFIKGKKYFSDVFDDLRDKIASEVEQENVRIGNQGCRWYLPTETISWLELWFDYRYINEEVKPIKSDEEIEDLQQYRFRGVDSLPLYQWGQYFDFHLLKAPKKHIGLMNLSVDHDSEKDSEHTKFWFMPQNVKEQD